MIKNLKIGKKLGLGFGLVILLTFFIGVISLIQINRISEDLKNLHYHPYTVSNAVREIKTNVIIMHRAMKDVALAKSMEDIENANKVAVEHRPKVHESFRLVLERFLGDKSKIEETYNAFKEWEIYRNQTYELMLAGKSEEAAMRTKSGGAEQVSNLLISIDYMIDFANNKAESFYNNSEKATKETLLLLLILFTITLLSALLVAYYISNKIRIPINRIVEGLHQVSEGDFTSKINYISDDEIGILASSFEKMKKSLIKYRIDAERKIDYLNNIPTPIHVIDNDFNVLFINKAAEIMISKYDKEWEGVKCYSLFNTSHCRTQNCCADKAMRTDGKCSGDTISIPNGKKEQPIRYISSPLKDETGNIVGAIEYILDITDEKEIIDMAERISNDDYSAKIEMRSEDDRLAKVLNTMSEKLLISKENNETIDWIKSGQHELMEKMRGHQDLTTLNKNIVTYLAKRIDAQIGTIYLADEEKQYLSLSSSYAFTEYNKHLNTIKFGEGLLGQAATDKEIIFLDNLPDNYIKIHSSLGNSVPKNLVIIPIVYEDNLLGVIELGKVKTIEYISLEFLKSVITNIAIAINSAMINDKTNKLLEQTQIQARELLDQQEELRSTNEELEEQSDRLRHSENELKSQQEELQVINEELEEKTYTLEKRQEEIKRKNLELENAKKVLEDKAKELEISSKYKSEFLANMSHELRTPLNSLLILSKNLASNKAGNLNEEDIESSEIIHNSGIDLLNLINDILDLSKIEAGKMSLNLENIAISEIKDLLTSQFLHVVEEKGISFNIDIDIDTGLPHTIYSDIQKVNQILKNLVSNAIKFTDEGGVSITISLPSSSVQFNHSKLSNELALSISVSDTGIGIQKEKQLEIFEAFQQGDGSTSRQFGGTGLGLSISRELAKMLGGEIQLTSEVGVGSTFTLYIPLKTEISDNNNINKDLNRSYKVKSNAVYKLNNTYNRAPTIDDDKEKLNDNDRKILVIEDDLNFAKTLYRFSQKKDFKCIHAGDGTYGLELANKYLPDAIILDLQLPDMEGWRVLEELKESINTRHIPVHIISATEYNINAYQKGAMGYLTKPIEIDQLDSAFQKMTKMMNMAEKKILIVEDDKNLRKTILKLVDSDDVQPVAVSTGKKALKEIATGTYDCIILDLKLPDLNGFEIISEMEKIPNIILPPVIIYTGKELTRDEEYELSKHTNSIIIKGVKSEERLLDETAMFLHQVVDELPESKKNIISMLHDKDAVLSNKKILVVDDDMRNVFAVSKILEEHGMVPFKAANGQKALEHLQNNNDIHLVLMDLMMPIMDGYETIKEIRKIEEFYNLPIIALTAKAMKGDKEKCIEAGANDYLTKPFEIDRLLSLLRIWLYK